MQILQLLLRSDLSDQLDESHNGVLVCQALKRKGQELCAVIILAGDLQSLELIFAEVPRRERRGEVSAFVPSHEVSEVDVNSVLICRHVGFSVGLLSVDGKMGLAPNGGSGIFRLFCCLERVLPRWRSPGRTVEGSGTLDYREIRALLETFDEQEPPAGE